MGLSLITQDGNVVSVYLVENDFIKVATFEDKDKYLIIRNIDGKLVIEDEVEK